MTNDNRENPVGVPLLGTLTQDADSPDWLYSEALVIPVLGPELRHFAFVGYEDDEHQEDFHEAIQNFLTLDQSALTACEESIFQYYEDIAEEYGFEEEDFPVISTPQEIWGYISIGESVKVSRRRFGDRAIYFSIGCGCRWEEEHGLQIIFKKGLFVNKVGPYDGHLTNADAFANPRLEEVVYHGFGE